MKLVVDMNILFSFFKKYSFTRRLLVNPGLELYSSEYALDEIKKYLDEIMLKSKIDIHVFELYRRILFWFVRFVPISEYKNFKSKAESITPDPNDTQYFALALSLKCPIWSNDKRLKKQKIVKIYSTDDLLGVIGKN